MNAPTMKMAVTLVLASLAAVGLPQRVLPISKERKEGEMTPPQVAARAQATLKALGLPLGMASGMKVSIEEYGHRSWYCESWDGAYCMSFEPTSGEVLSFYNRLKANAPKKQGRTGRHFYKSEREAEEHLLRLAKKLGVDNAVGVGKLEIYEDGEVEDVNPLGFVGGAILDAEGKILAHMSCDIQDGVLRNFSIFKGK